MDKILKLKALHMDKVWGYEKWILSTHNNGISFVEGYEENLLEYLGEKLPILVKEIKADSNLSVQVHPSDSYAMKYENEFGKTECWYILDCSNDSTLICGINEGVTKEEFERSISDGSVENLIKRIKINKGDMIYIPSGTVHAIEGGVTILEIQQCSDVTYRVYDWGRDRELHIDKALDVINFNNNNGGKIDNFNKLETEYFVVEKLNVNGIYRSCSKDKYEIYICVDGNGYIKNDESIEIKINKLDCIYVYKGCNYTIDGNLNLLKIIT